MCNVQIPYTPGQMLTRDNVFGYSSQLVDLVDLRVPSNLQQAREAYSHQEGDTALVGISPAARRRW